MKKLVAFAAVALCAVLANASTVTWGAASASAVDSSKIATGTMYLAYASGTVDFTAFDNQTAFSSATLTAAGFTKIIDTFSYSSTTYSKKNNAITPTATGLSGSVSAYAILIEEGEGADYLAYSSSPVSFSVAAAVGMNQNKTVSAFTYVQTVPEPTSGLLMLLGMAGLALRRRRA